MRPQTQMWLAMVNPHRNPIISLTDIDTAVNEINDIVHGMNAVSYLNDRNTQLAVERLLINIGEATSNLRRIFGKEHLDKIVPESSDIIRFRNNLARILHEWKTLVKISTRIRTSMILPDLGWFSGDFGVFSGAQAHFPQPPLFVSVPGQHSAGVRKC